MKNNYFKKLVRNIFAFALVATLASFAFSPDDAYALDPDPSDGLKALAPGTVTCYSTIRTRHGYNIWKIFRCDDCDEQKVYKYEDSGTCETS